MPTRNGSIRWHFFNHEDLERGINYKGIEACCCSDFENHDVSSRLICPLFERMTPGIQSTIKCRYGAVGAMS